MPASRDEADGSSRQETLRHVIRLLKEALEKVDALGNHLEVGARLADLIESLERECDEAGDL